MKRIFKNIICVFWGIVFIFLTACGNIKTKQNDNKLNVIATIFPCYDFAKQISGGLANVEMLLPPGQESHSYEPTPQNIIDISNADIFIYNGGDADAWVDDILSSIDTSKITIIRMTDCVKTIDEKVVPGMDTHLEDDEDESEPEKDEHVWTSLRNSEKITEDICNAFCNVDKKNSRTYKSNCTCYVKKMKNLDNQYKETVKTAKRKEIIFGDRFPFAYLARDYGLTYYAAFVGCSEQTEASAKTVAFLIDKVKSDNIPTVFYIEFSSHLIANTISDETGAKIAELNSAHDVSKKQLDEGLSYVDIMTDNLKVLQIALN